MITSARLDSRAPAGFGAALLEVGYRLATAEPITEALTDVGSETPRPEGPIARPSEPRATAAGALTKARARAVAGASAGQGRQDRARTGGNANHPLILIGGISAFVG